MIEFGDCRETMRRWAAEGIQAQTCVTSPPYFGLRDYGHEGQIGLEQTPEEYIAALVEVFRCVRDILADDGTLWLNIGDSYADQRGHQPARISGSGAMVHGQGKGAGLPQGYKPKDMLGIPWMLAFALRADGWYLRQDIIWHKPNPMPESVTDRCVKSHEYLFLLSKSQRYFFDHEAIKEPAKRAGEIPGGTGRHIWHGAGGHNKDGLNSNAAQPVKDMRNRRSVWTVATRPYKGAHFATFPPDLIEPCILAGAPPGGTVIDPFMGSGTVAEVCILNERQYLGCELNSEYEPLQAQRIADATERYEALAAQMELFA